MDACVKRGSRLGGGAGESKVIVGSSRSFSFTEVGFSFNDNRGDDGDDSDDGEDGDVK